MNGYVKIFKDKGEDKYKNKELVSTKPFGLR